jgi:hypothetical protein
MHPGFTERDAGPTLCQARCGDDAHDACADGYCIQCCSKNGRDNGDGYACDDCRIELYAEHIRTFPMRSASASGLAAARLSEPRRVPPARSGSPAAATHYITDRIVTCGMPACGRAILASRGFQVTGYDEVLCSECTSSLKDCEVTFR